MKERPLLFRGEMVRAILRDVDPKTQTRRPLKPQPQHPFLENAPSDWMYPRTLKNACPYGIPGDRLWVRETFWRDKRDPNNLIVYAADDCKFYKLRIGSEPRRGDDAMSNEYLRNHKWWEQRPSIFMPRWASRILLEVCEVRVERLNDISPLDCVDEGIPASCADCYGHGPHASPNEGCGGATHPERLVEEYARLWESTYGPHAWELNPWVWVVKFRRLEP